MVGTTVGTRNFCSWGSIPETCDLGAKHQQLGDERLSIAVVGRCFNICLDLRNAVGQARKM